MSKEMVSFPLPLEVFRGAVFYLPEDILAEWQTGCLSGGFSLIRLILPDTVSAAIERRPPNKFS